MRVLARLLSLVLALFLIVLLLTVLYVKPALKYSYNTTTSFNTTIGGEAGVVSELGEVPWVKLTVLVDNSPNPFNSELVDAWGLSILVETPFNVILFDAGPDPLVLQHNVEVLDKSLEKASFIVISHEHGDHVRGLEYIAGVNGSITVYIPGHAPRSIEEWIKSVGFKHVVRVYSTIKLSEGVAVVGELYGPPYEQALAVNVKGLGLVVLAGCSHPA